MPLIKKYLHELFEVGVLLKALNSIWETATGLFVFFAAHPVLGGRGLELFSREEYLGGRHDALFLFVAEQLNHLSVSTKNFISAYLLIHGLLNMVLAYNLRKNRLWAFPLAMGVTCLFLIYQIYRIFHTHSVILFGVTLFDIFFVYLTLCEYELQKKKLKY